MKYLKIIVAFIATIGIASLVDLIVNFIFETQIDFGGLGKIFWIIVTTIGRAAIGWFFGIECFKFIYSKLEE